MFLHLEWSGNFVFGMYWTYLALNAECGGALEIPVVQIWFDGWIHVVLKSESVGPLAIVSRRKCVIFILERFCFPYPSSPWVGVPLKVPVGDLHAWSKKRK